MPNGARETPQGRGAADCSDLREAVQAYCVNPKLRLPSDTKKATGGRGPMA